MPSRIDISRPCVAPGRRDGGLGGVRHFVQEHVIATSFVWHLHCASHQRVKDAR